MPTSELSVPNALSTTLQPIQDEASNRSALSIATNVVQVGQLGDIAPGNLSFIVNAPIATANGPSVLLASQSAESAIRFTAVGSEAFHIGVGGHAGPGTFFIFSGLKDVGLVVTIEADGDVRMQKNLTVGGTLSVGSIDGSQTKLVNVPPATVPLKHLMIDPTGKLFTQ